MRTYGFIAINSNGWLNGGESFLKIKDNSKDAMESAYYSYKKNWNELQEFFDDKDEQLLSFESFETEMIGLGYVTIQLTDYHIQYEWFEKKVTLNY